MKKKILTLILALMLLMSMSVPAWAGGVTASGGTQETTLSHDVASGFTVNIPDAATVGTPASIGVSGMLDVGQSLSVKITAATNYAEDKFYLANGTQTLEYSITADKDGVGGDEPAAVALNTAFATYTAAQVHNVATCAMNFILKGTPTQGGEYTDHLTFTVTVAAAS